MSRKNLFGSGKAQSGWWRVLGALLVSAFLLGFFLPFERHQWLTLALYVPLALALRRAGPLSGFLTGLLFGVVAWAGGTWWLLHSMSSMLHLSLWQGLGALMVVWLYQGLPFGLFGLVCGWMNKRGRRAGPVFCAGLLTLLIFIRPRLCPVSSAVSVALWPAFIQVADLGGEYLVLFLLLLLNWLLADLLFAFWQGQRRTALIRAIGFAVLLGIVLGYGTWRIDAYGENAARPDGKKMTIASVQPAVPVRWGTQEHPLAAFASADEMCLQSLSAYMGTVKRAGLLLFPEMPRFECLSSEFAASGLLAALLRLNIPALLPTDEYAYAPKTQQIVVDADQDFVVTTRKILAKYNSIFVLEPGNELTLAYRKVRLVPFSEATPLRTVFPAVQNILGHSLEVTEGDGPHLISINGLEIQPLICFESGFPGLVRQGVSMGANVLVEVSNDGWFAARTAEMKHLGMGIFRTVEFRRPLVRCSNSGCGAFVRTSGELVANTLTPHGRSCVTSAEVCPSEVTTVYAVWGNCWLWAVVLLVLWRMGDAVTGRVRVKSNLFPVSVELKNKTVINN